jgi:hypothetical protein
MWEHQHKHTFADENYAREIMQVSLHHDARAAIIPV